MFFRRRKPRSRIKSSPQRWAMKRRRSRGLKVRQLMKGRVIATLGLITLIALTIYVIFFTAIFQIMSVEIFTEYKDINPEKLEKYMNAKSVGENALRLDFTAINEDVYLAFPEVSLFSCSRKLFKRVLSCDAVGFELVAVIKHEGKKYYINENGVVIAFDSRKLGLPIFDLILNPVYADFPLGELDLAPTPEVPSEPVLDPAPKVKSLAENLIANKGFEEKLAEEGVKSSEPIDPELLLEETTRADPSLKFIQPFEEPPIESVIQDEAREVFKVSVGKKILDPDELLLILEAIGELEKVLQRKVIHAKYVQVAGELSLTSKPAPEPPKEKGNAVDTGKNPAPEEEDIQVEEDPEHELTFLIDLRRNLDKQFIKLKKTKEVIDFTEVSRIDLSVDGEKVFYR